MQTSLKHRVRALQRFRKSAAKRSHMLDMGLSTFQTTVQTYATTFEPKFKSVYTRLDLDERYSQSDEAGFRRNQPHCALESRVMC
jgi:hypothetical protein